MRILVTGAESSGKSTASKWLKQEYNLTRRPEYAREYLNQLNRSYTPEDILKIASVQRQQDLTIQSSTTQSIHDTGAEILLFWYKYATGVSHPDLEDYLTEQHYDLCFLMAPNLPWTADPLREHPNKEDRLSFTRAYQNLLENQGTPIVLIDRLGENRLTQMKEFLENQFKFQK